MTTYYLTRVQHIMSDGKYFCFTQLINLTLSKTHQNKKNK